LDLVRVASDLKPDATFLESHDDDVGEPLLVDRSVDATHGVKVSVAVSGLD